jgi:hypothetical protein
MRRQYPHDWGRVHASERVSNERWTHFEPFPHSLLSKQRRGTTRRRRSDEEQTV